MPPNTYWSPDVALVEAIRPCNADWPMVCSVAPELAVGVHTVRLVIVDWALALIVDSAFCAVARVVDTRLFALVSVWISETCSLSDSS